MIFVSETYPYEVVFRNRGVVYRCDYCGAEFAKAGHAVRHFLKVHVEGINDE